MSVTKGVSHAMAKPLVSTTKADLFVPASMVLSLSVKLVSISTSVLRMFVPIIACVKTHKGTLFANVKLGTKVICVMISTSAVEIMFVLITVSA